MFYFSPFTAITNWTLGNLTARVVPPPPQFLVEQCTVQEKQRGSKKYMLPLLTNKLLHMKQISKCEYLEAW